MGKQYNFSLEFPIRETTRKDEISLHFEIIKIHFETLSKFCIVFLCYNASLNLMPSPITSGFIPSVANLEIMPIRARNQKMLFELGKQQNCIKFH